MILERYDAGHIFLFTLGLWTVLNGRGVCRPVIVGLMGFSVLLMVQCQMGGQIRSC